MNITYKEMFGCNMVIKKCISHSHRQGRPHTYTHTHTHLKRGGRWRFTHVRTQAGSAGCFEKHAKVESLGLAPSPRVHTQTHTHTGTRVIAARRPGESFAVCFKSVVFRAEARANRVMGVRRADCCQFWLLDNCCVIIASVMETI